MVNFGLGYLDNCCRTVCPEFPERESGYKWSICTFEEPDLCQLYCVCPAHAVAHLQQPGIFCLSPCDVGGNRYPGKGRRRTTSRNFWQQLYNLLRKNKPGFFLPKILASTISTVIARKNSACEETAKLRKWHLPRNPTQFKNHKIAL